MDGFNRNNAPPEMVQNENIQKAIKILGATLMVTKTKGLETTFYLVDQFGVKHQYHLDISEQIIMVPGDE